MIIMDRSFVIVKFNSQLNAVYVIIFRIVITQSNNFVEPCIIIIIINELESFFLIFLESKPENKIV